MEGLSGIISEGLAFLMLFMAMIISTSPTVHEMIPLYQFQSAALAMVTLVTAASSDTSDLASWIFRRLFTIIPVLLGLLIEPLLALASVPENLSTVERIRRLIRILSAIMLKPLLTVVSFIGGRWAVDRFPGQSSREMLETARQNAYPVWLARRSTQRLSFWPILLDLLLTVLAFNVAYALAQNGSFEENILAISFSLLLIGLSIMRSKQDIIAQMMGLLVMEHGMFLAAIRMITTSEVVIAFVISLLLYIIITLTILVILLPDLHRVSGKIDIDQQDQLKG